MNAAYVLIPDERNDKGIASSWIPSDDWLSDAEVKENVVEALYHLRLGQADEQRSIQEFADAYTHWELHRLTMLADLPGEFVKFSLAGVDTTLEHVRVYLFLDGDHAR